MDESLVFKPPRRAGIIFHLAVILVLSGAAGALFVLATSTELGPAFLFYLLGALALAVPLPTLFYRLYALAGASYRVERDGVHIRWGMRAEDIPMPDIDWIRPAEEDSLPMPRPRWPGSVLGVKEHPKFGMVEFIASRGKRLILIGTQKRVYAISPREQESFVEALQRQMELGSLTPLTPRSSRPGFLAADLWSSRGARALLVIGAVLNLAVLIWVALIVPTLTQVSLGFSASGTLLEPVPAAQMFLLPVINLFFYLANFGLGTFFFRQPKGQTLAYVLWGSSALTAALFLGAVNVILANS